MTPAATASGTEGVGPVLEAGETSRGVIAAIREQNRDVEVVDRGAYVRVIAPSPCVLARKTVERILGRPFRLPSDLELIMPSFRGVLSVTEEDVTWTWTWKTADSR